MSVYNAGETIKRKRGRLFEVSTLLGQHSQQKKFWTTFFLQIGQEGHLKKW